jgi:hypothetical protein
MVTLAKEGRQLTRSEDRWNLDSHMRGLVGNNMSIDVRLERRTDSTANLEQRERLGVK